MWPLEPDMTAWIELTWHAPSDAASGAPPGSQSVAGFPLRVLTHISQAGDEPTGASAWIGLTSGQQPAAPAVHVRAATWSAAWSLAEPLLWSLAAELSASVHLRGTFVPSGGTDHYLLLAGTAAAGHFARAAQPAVSQAAQAPHVLVSTAAYPAQATAFLQPSAADREHVATGPLPVSGILVAITAEAADGRAEYIPAGDARLMLAATAGAGAWPELPSWTAAGRDLAAGLRRRADRRLGELVAALPMFGIHGTGPGLPTRFEPPAAPLDYTPDQLAHLREMQVIAGAVYGRLEADRAIAWFTEELGELAQAIRRREGIARQSEEIGQLFSWVLCLANICEVDLARSARAALWHEAMRQVTKYGELRPYQPGAWPRAAT
jgi:NTP pyrophosphatase (non-canonical NTP hydrolase)